MNGGTPYEQDVAVEASVTKGSKMIQQSSTRVQTKRNFSETFEHPIKKHDQPSCLLSSSSSRCPPADAPGPTAAQTDHKVEINQQSDQKAALVGTSAREKKNKTKLQTLTICNGSCDLSQYYTVYKSLSYSFGDVHLSVHHLSVIYSMCVHALYCIGRSYKIRGATSTKRAILF